MGTRRASLTGAVRPSGWHSHVPGLRPVQRSLLWLRGALGRRLSVRSKLTVWYGVMCGITLLLAGTATDIYVQHQLSDQIENDLRSTGATVNAALARPLTNVSNRTLSVPAGCQHYIDSSFKAYCAKLQVLLNQSAIGTTKPGVFEQVILDPANERLNAPSHQIPFITPLGRPYLAPSGMAAVLVPIEALAGEFSFFTFSSGGHDYRAYFVRLRVPPHLQADSVSGVLEVLQNEGTYQQVEHTVQVTLLLALPLGLLVALVIGWWIARTALRPINRISRTVKRIGESEDLSRRVNFRGPHDELGELAQTFDYMMDRIEGVFETQKRFIAEASHELRTPLTAIRGNADLMRIAPPEDRDICVDAIRREAERMTRLVSDLLVLAEADVATQQIQRRPLDLDEVLLDVYQSALFIADGRVAVILEHSDPICINGDADRLKQLLLNLVDNAIKFTPNGGTVSLGQWEDSGSARLSVSDSGLGIAPEEQAAIFERFYRVERSRSQRGSGLGLSICAWIAAAHGGRISVSSEVGKGSTFTVFLPIEKHAG